ncbi:MAG: caspase family protein [Chloroflexales bacterium]
MTGSFRCSTAVIIGIEQYAHGIPCLSTPVNDATHLSTLLASEHGYRPILLTEEVTKARLTRLFCEELPQAMTADDRLLVYFAGHGVALEGQDRPEGYLLLQDARADESTTFLNMAELYDWLKVLPCRHLLLILDCCFAGAMRWSSMRDLRPRQHVLYRERFERFTNNLAWQILTSAAHDQKALDVISGEVLGQRADRRVDGRRHSPFALALFEALRGAADLFPKGQGDGVITATELYLYLRESVENRAATDAHHEQTPGLWSMPRYEQGKLRPTDKGEYIFLTPNFDERKLPSALPLILEHNPYRGLEPYTEQYSELFFGRSALVEQLLERVKGQPFTVVLGPSGSGKSSLVQAGLIPALRKAGGYTILPPLRPADQPFTYLCQLLSTQLGTSTDASNSLALAQAVGGWLAVHPDQLILVVDQLEELITVCREEHEAEQFVQTLTALLESHPDRLRVVLTLRNDFEPSFDRRWFVRWWAHEPARFVVQAMSADELRKVIEEPALARVLHFEPPELVDTLMSEVRDAPGALPLLSFTLSELYRQYVTSQREDRALTITHYQKLHGVFGALLHRAEEEFWKLPDAAHRATMCRVMRRMVALEGGELSRRQVFYTELNYPDPEENRRVQHILNRLIDERLLVPDSVELGGKKLVSVEPAHDALVRAWDQFMRRERIIEDDLLLQEDDLLLQRRVTQAAIDWEQTEAQQRTRMLWNDNPRLQQLQVLLQPEGAPRPGGRSLPMRVRQTLWPPTISTTGPTWLNKVETDFVLASIVLRRNRWRQLVTWVTLAFTTITIVAIVALVQRNEAQTQRQEAVTQRNEAQTQRQEALHQLNISESQRLAQLAQNRLANQPEQALLLAYEAGTRNENAASDQALWDSLDQVRSTRYGDGVDRVESAALSPDGNYLLLVPARNTPNPNRVTMWDLVNQRPISLTVEANSMYSAQFSPDSQQIVTTDSDGYVRTWDLQGRQIEAFKPFTVGISLYRDARFTSDGRILALDSNNGAHLLVSEQAAPVTNFIGHEQWVWAAEISSDGQHVLTSGRDGVAILWDLEGRKLVTFKPGGTGAWAEARRWQAVFSPDGQHVLTPGEDGVVRLWDLNGQELVRFEGHAKRIRSAVFSHEGQAILTASDDATARLWDLHGKELLVLKLDHGVSVASFSPDDRYILTASGPTLRLWNLDGRQILTLEGHTEDIRQVAFSQEQDRHRIVSVGNDGFVRIWGLDPLPLTMLDPSATSTFSPNRQQVLATGQTGGSTLVSLSGARPITFTDSLREPVFSADGRYLLAKSPGPVRLWTTRGQPLATFDAESSAVSSMALSTDGQTILTASGGTARLWNADGSLRASLKHPTGAITVVALEPQGQHALTAGDDAVPILWDLQSNQQTELIGHTGSIVYATFSPDGQWIVTTAQDGTARLWNQTGLLSQTFQFEGQNILSAMKAQFSPDSQRFLVWDAQVAQQTQKAKVWGLDGQVITDLSWRAGGITSATFNVAQRCPLSTSASGVADAPTPYLLTTSTDGVARLWDDSGTQRMLITAEPPGGTTTLPTAVDVLLAQLGGVGHVTQATFAQDTCEIIVLTDRNLIQRSVYRMPDMLAVAACRVGRGLTEQELRDFHLSGQQRFDFAARLCPPTLTTAP